MIRVKQNEVFFVTKSKLEKHGVSTAVAEECAKLLVENSLDGIYSHGVNRFQGVILYLDRGYIKPNKKPEKVMNTGPFERWDGNLCMGNTSAKMCMNRAIEIAKEYGIGCVALRNTNHWISGGAYRLQAADAGCIGICLTNTQPNMPTLGAKDRRIGNNPLIMCVPFKEGHVMMDEAMAQFSSSAIESAKLGGKQLPVPGGFDSKGNITCDPIEIEKNWRVLPIGYWKGSSMSILLDIIAASLADGNAGCDVGKLSEDEYGLSQVFIAIDIKKTDMKCEEVVRKVVDDIRSSERVNENEKIFYPTEMSYLIREDDINNGIPSNEIVWETILCL